MIEEHTVSEKANAQEFDVLVLGGGSAGYAAALRAVQYGMTVGLVEKAKLGGTCLHWGASPPRPTCTPLSWQTTPATARSTA